MISKQVQDRFLLEILLWQSFDQYLQLTSVIKILQLVSINHGWGWLQFLIINPRSKMYTYRTQKKKSQFSANCRIHYRIDEENRVMLYIFNMYYIYISSSPLIIIPYRVGEGNRGYHAKRSYSRAQTLWKEEEEEEKAENISIKDAVSLDFPHGNHSPQEHVLQTP